MRLKTYLDDLHTRSVRSAAGRQALRVLYLDDGVGALWHGTSCEREQSYEGKGLRSDAVSKARQVRDEGEVGKRVS